MTHLESLTKAHRLRNHMSRRTPILLDRMCKPTKDQLSTENKRATSLSERGTGRLAKT